MNLLRRLVLVAQGGTVAYTFRCDEASITATRLDSWDVWNRSLPDDRETMEVRVVSASKHIHPGWDSQLFASSPPPPPSAACCRAALR